MTMISIAPALRTAVCLFAVCATAAAQAHDTWVIARPGAGSQIDVQLTSGGVFPGAETAVEAARLTRADLLVLGGATLELQPGAGGQKYLALSADPGTAGLFGVRIETAPRDLQLSAEQVEEYLEELGNPPELRAGWEASGEWRERYRKHAKAMLRTDPKARASKASLDLGLGFEIVPMLDPTVLLVGQPMVFRLEHDDQPLAGQRVGIVYANSPEPDWTTTDENGFGRFMLNHPGWAMLRSIRIAASDDQQIDWESDFTTLVFEIPHPEIPQLESEQD